jgi:hypothetical protein
MPQQYQETAQSDRNEQLQTLSSSDQPPVEKLLSTLRGELILPGDPAYETERKVWITIPLRSCALSMSKMSKLWSILPVSR